MRKKNYKGAKCTKRYVNKCDDVCKTYDAIQYAYANLLSEAEEGSRSKSMYCCKD